ncbi:MAG TPA: alpha/beta hydrolase [Magnetospirillum sp.]|nr:alpha/beta hydrolase [Magnetospirillum sp.]
MITPHAEPRSRYLTVAGHEMHVTEWGDREAPPVIMWHGLARVGRDFDTLARHLAPMFHIVCPDTVGRGLSSWSSNPVEDYIIPAYCGHALELMDRLGVERVRWVGTSMGGIIGMALAGTAATAGRIERLVVNDVGPHADAASIDRIKAYVTLVPEFPTMEKFAAFLRLAYAPFGKLTDDEWRRMAETSVRRRDNGTFSPHYDPAVMQVFADHGGAFDMWEGYDAIRCPTLLIRGENSDLLTAETAQSMMVRGPKAQLFIVPGCGHAPMLNTADQIAVLKGFLA